MTTCSNCGAPLPQSSDGQLGACGYCHAGKARTVDPVALAQTLERDLADVRAFVEKLAVTLESAFRSQTKVERSGLFSKKVSRLEVTLGDHVFRVEADGDHAQAFRSRVVRGVAVKNESLPLSRWVSELARSLAHVAEENAEARSALARFGH